MPFTLCRVCPVIVALYLALSFAGCATTVANLRPETPAMHRVSEFSDDEWIAGLDDPWGGLTEACTSSATTSTSGSSSPW